MKTAFDVWRRQIWLWAPALAFCVLNLLVFTFYRTTFAGKVERLERSYEKGSKRLTALVGERERIEGFLARMQTHRGEATVLYRDYFQTEELRFTRAIDEVRSLASKAGLRPTSIGLPETRFGEYGLIQRNFNFSVTGTYEQLRMFINFLELSEHFLTLESVRLAESTQENRRILGIGLALSTVFSAREIEAPATEEET